MDKTETNQKKGVKVTNVVIIVLCVIMVFIVAFLIISGIKIGTQSVNDKYITAKEQTKNEMKDKFRQMGFEKGESDYHVSNRATISVESIKETAKLEVLEVSDVEFVNAKDESNGIEAFYEVPGVGVYTVDLEAAEYVVDKNRCFVLVRVPAPELTECSINYEKVGKLVFENRGGNDSIKVGEDLAKKMFKNADILIKKEFASNNRYYDSAEASAESLIKNMVKELNPTIEDLEVKVEFVK